jgi:hypothetical protein
MDPVERREFMKGAAIGALAFSVGGIEVLLTPKEALAQDVPLKMLSTNEARTLEAVSETLVPGARQAGIALFVDQQCSVPPHEALLSLRIANGRPPFVNFYRAVLVEIDRQCGTRYGKKFADISAVEQRETINLIRQGKLEDWKGPSQGQIYGIFRDDGVDVVYGTVEGFELLGVPYMAHIMPKARW